MASTVAVRRLSKEYADMLKNPTPHIEAHPEPNNILTWYFVFEGPLDSFYQGGEYLGRIQFANNHPLAPPTLYISTPSGRFQTETSICLSFSVHHPDQWSPVWTVPKMIQGLVSFMLEEQKALGTMETDESTKRILAAKSIEFNLQHPAFQRLFPKRVEALVEKLGVSRSTLLKRRGSENPNNNSKALASPKK